jgi:hypothetical protein
MTSTQVRKSQLASAHMSNTLYQLQPPNNFVRLGVLILEDMTKEFPVYIHKSEYEAFKLVRLEML